MTQEAGLVPAWSEGNITVEGLTGWLNGSPWCKLTNWPSMTNWSSWVRVIIMISTAMKPLLKLTL